MGWVGGWVGGEMEIKANLSQRRSWSWGWAWQKILGSKPCYWHLMNVQCIWPSVTPDSIPALGFVSKKISQETPGNSCISEKRKESSFKIKETHRKYHDTWSNLQVTPKTQANFIEGSQHKQDPACFSRLGWFSLLLFSIVVYIELFLCPQYWCWWIID